MTKIFFFLLICIVLTSCSYVLLPHEYFNKYSQIKGDKNKDTISLNFSHPYVVEDLFLTKSYSETLGKKIKSYRYIFLYKNNLMATIEIPLINYSNGYIFDEKALNDSILNGFFSRPENQDRINWDYFKIEGNKFIICDFKYLQDISSGANILMPVAAYDHTPYIIENNTLTHNYSYILNKDPAVNVSEKYIQSTKVSAKPDSTQSYFIKMYDKYMKTGIRKYYPYYPDFEKHQPKKK